MPEVLVLETGGAGFDSVDELVLRVEGEMGERLEAEAEEILMAFNTTPKRFTPLVEVARGVELRTILLHAAAKKIPAADIRTRFFNLIRSLEQVSGKDTPDFYEFEKSMRSLLPQMGFIFQGLYRSLYQGLCDMHFQRKNGVASGRKDVGADYLPSSPNSRPGVGMKNCKGCGRGYLTITLAEDYDNFRKT